MKSYKRSAIIPALGDSELEKLKYGSDELALTKEEWRLIISQVKPELDDAEFDRLWDTFQKKKREGSLRPN